MNAECTLLCRIKVHCIFRQLKWLVTMVRMHSELGKMKYSLMLIEQQSVEHGMSSRYIISTSMHL